MISLMQIDGNSREYHAAIALVKLCPELFKDYNCRIFIEDVRQDQYGGFIIVFNFGDECNIRGAGSDYVAVTLLDILEAKGKQIRTEAIKGEVV